MRRKVEPSQRRRKRSIQPGPSTGLRTGPSTGLRLRTEPAEAADPSEERRIETTIPLDAEELVLDSLEAKVRAEEAKLSLGSSGALDTLVVRLPSAAMAELRAQAAERRIAPSKLAEIAMTRFLEVQKKKARRR